ncbi:glycosyltransferase family A protein [Isoptericola rhizosphaerae]|uniref:glycosyltransferase family A protein n=1 Tax=Isoptericola rhizosphaerae TaxID=3377837 RepID=UPI00383B901B
MSPAAARPTVSVVVPARDDADELDRCLALLAAQSVAPLEVVVVDNASRDATAEVARRWGAVVVPEPRLGIPAAAAAGYDAARGDVIARLDADSRPGPHWVRSVVDSMTTDPAPDAVTGRPGLRRPTTKRRPGSFGTALAAGAPPRRLVDGGGDAHDRRRPTPGAGRGRLRRRRRCP